MREQMLDDVVARRFLLGQLPPGEEGYIEELAFEDPDTFTFLESIEDDLIDEFIQGDLSAVEEQQFKSHFLSLPGSRNNLKVSRMLQQRFEKAVVPDMEGFSFPTWFKLQRPWLQISMTATALALVILALWIFIRVRGAGQPAPIQAGPNLPVAVPSAEFKVSPLVEPTTPAHVENKPKSPTPGRPKKSATYAILLPSASPRGEGGQQLTLAPDTPSMTIELALFTQGKFRTYEAALENEEGKELQRWSNLRAERLTTGKALKIDFPVALVKPQEFYRIVVSGVSPKGKTEVIARYPFEVSK